MSGFKIQRSGTKTVQVTVADLNPSTLNSKINVGGGLTKTVQNPGANETLLLSTSVTPGQVAVTGADTTPGYLSSKTVAGTGITLAVLNPGGDEDLQITNSVVGFSKITSADTTPAVLNSKITAGDWVVKSTLNPAGNETLKLSFAPSSAVSISASDIDWINPNQTFYKTLAANTTFTFSNTVEGKTIIVALTNTASNFTVAWPAGVKWTNATTPTMTVGVKTDVYTFVIINSIIYGSYVQNFT